jgi:hypothetical protein
LMQCDGNSTFLLKKINSDDLNCGPLSDIMEFGIPCLAKWAFSFLITVCEVVLSNLSTSQKLLM